MAVSDYLLEIKGPDLKGESQDDQYKESIHIDSWRLLLTWWPTVSVRPGVPLCHDTGTPNLERPWPFPVSAPRCFPLGQTPRRYLWTWS